MTSNDQRLQFEYVFPSHSIFSDVNFLTQPKSSAFAHGSSDFQNFIASTYNNPSQNNHPSTTSLQGGGSSEENSASIIQIRVDNNQHPDDEEFNPSSDGELVNNQCIKCGLDPGSSTELKLHFGAVHQRQTFECCVCNKLFIRRHGFLVHIKKYHEDVTGKSFPCPFCEHIYTTSTALNEHCHQKHKYMEPILCPLCLTQIPEGGMKLHIESEHSINPAATTSSNILEYSASSSNTIPPHVKKEEQQQQQQMEFKKCVAKKSLPKIFHQCELCSYRSTRAERLRVHIKGVHMSSRPFPCTQCSKEFKQKDKLLRHIQSVHTPIKPYSCEFCNMAFSRKDELCRHGSIVHGMMGGLSGEKKRNTNPYHQNNNSVSIRRTTTVNNIKDDDMNSEVVHNEGTKLLPSSSTSADMMTVTYEQFGNKSQQQQLFHSHHHLVDVNSVVVDRPHACHFCDKKFKVKDKLNMHINTVHLKKKPFKCQYCHQAFGRRDAMKRHQSHWCSMKRNVCKTETTTATTNTTAAATDAVIQ